ncbi:metallophosphoesterase family protein [Haloarchaeobius sp. DFWS5]|uniref:metallophosphoesterase family protein n=1 Tax=Haloarchaeobius sp. DFWS5 TaxID=3446114 RepID=UPI003EC0B1C4
MSTPAPSFPDDDDARHQTVDADDWDEIYLVGDVHGCLDALEKLLAELDPSDDDLVVFVGDLVRKGPDSQGVVERVREADNMISVRGNNEDKLIRGDKELPELTDEDMAYIHEMPVALSFDDALVVHGGIDPRKPLDDHTPNEVLNMRSLAPDGSYDRPYWFEEHADGPRVFFGHTVLESPVERRHAVGLDTGCVYGGELTAYSYWEDEFVAVSLDGDGKGRKDSKIVTPPAKRVA